jgi:hypothetical protein
MRIAALVILVISLMGSPALAVTVPGTSNPWLAGMPDGTTAPAGDVAPGQSPVLVLGVLPAPILTFSATGAVNYAPSFPFADPDGADFYGHGVEHGISDIYTTLNCLLGVFLGAAQPDSSPAPAGLNFSTFGLNFTSLYPELKQVFFIGDGLTGTGVGQVQQFIVPAGATRLFLGTMDGSGWNNNQGSFEVQVTPVPVPGSLVFLGSGLLSLAGWRRFRKC